MHLGLVFPVTIIIIMGIEATQTGDKEMAIINYDGEASYTGAVLMEYENNGYHDSDFFAVVWTGAELKTIQFATTRAGCGKAFATKVDATPETWAKVGEFCKSHMIDILESDAQAKAREISKGKRVRVMKGRKVKPGTEGVVFWIGQPQKFGYYSAPVTKIGIATTDRKETAKKRNGKGVYERYADVEFVNAAHCEVIEPDNHIDHTGLKHLAKVTDPERLFRMHRGATYGRAMQLAAKYAA